MTRPLTFGASIINMSGAILCPADKLRQYQEFAEQELHPDAKLVIDRTQRGELDARFDARIPDSESTDGREKLFPYRFDAKSLPTPEALEQWFVGLLEACVQFELLHKYTEDFAKAPQGSDKRSQIQEQWDTERDAKLAKLNAIA